MELAPARATGYIPGRQAETGTMLQNVDRAHSSFIRWPTAGTSPHHTASPAATSGSDRGGNNPTKKEDYRTPLELDRSPKICKPRGQVAQRTVPGPSHLNLGRLPQDKVADGPYAVSRSRLRRLFFLGASRGVRQDQ